MRVPPKVRAGLLIVGLAVTLGLVRWADNLSDTGDAAARGVDAKPRAHSERQASTPQAAALDLEKLQRGPQQEPESDPFGTRDFRPPPPPKPKNAAGALPALALPPPPRPPPPQ